MTDRSIPASEIVKDLKRDEPIYLQVTRRGDGNYKEIKLKLDAYEIYVERLKNRG